MRMNINAVLEGQEILDEFKAKVATKGVEGGNYKIQVQKSNGDWVDVAPEKLKLVFDKE